MVRNRNLKVLHGLISDWSTHLCVLCCSTFVCSIGQHFISALYSHACIYLNNFFDTNEMTVKNTISFVFIVKTLSFNYSKLQVSQDWEYGLCALCAVTIKTSFSWLNSDVQRRLFWCVRMWPYRSRVWSFRIIKPVLFQSLIHTKSRLSTVQLLVKSFAYKFVPC